MARPAVITGADRTLQLLEHQVGLPLDEVETPVAVVDLDRADANIARLARYAADHGIELWPHTKTHKSPELGRRQLAQGAGGLTVAKTGEAQVFHEAGAPRLLVHYPPLGPAKWDRLAQLAADGLDLTVAVDAPEQAEGLGAALVRAGATAELLIEVDVGLHRTGVGSAPEAVALAGRLARIPGVELAGLSCYPGHCRGDETTVRERLADVDVRLCEVRDALAAAGHRADRVSGGSTPTRYLTHTTCVNELRSGTYVFLDRKEAPSEPDGGIAACALWVEASVISTSVPGQVVIDAGSKTLTSDAHPDGGHGAVLGAPEAVLHTLNEEHGYLDVRELEVAPRLGQHLRVVPNHACGCVNLHDGLLGVRDGVVECVLPVAARGLVR
jgi:D-serine deaminase-like pyridoxal phosphate-dependent protein